MTYRERKERRAERRAEWARKRKAKSEAAFSAVKNLADQIPLGQPILVGHHSERRARRDADRISSNMTKGIEHDKMASKHTSVAGGIAHLSSVNYFSRSTTIRIPGLHYPSSSIT